MLRNTSLVYKIYISGSDHLREQSQHSMPSKVKHMLARLGIAMVRGKLLGVV